MAAHDLPTLESPHAWVRKRAFAFQRTPTHVHNGIDLPGSEGSPVYAIGRGRVVQATNAWQQGFTGYGKVVVVLADDGTHHLYAHLRRPLVNVGDIVEPGAELGEVGRTEFSKADHDSLFTSGAHLHLEVARKAYPLHTDDHAARIDPVPYLLGGRVHPLKRIVMGDGPAIPEPVPPVSDGSSIAEAPFVAPAARGAFLRLSGVCPHCLLRFSSVATIELEKGHV